MDYNKLLRNIYFSDWWKTAMTTPDSHFHKRHNITLKDHLQSIADGVELLLDRNSANEYLHHLHSFLDFQRFRFERLHKILKIVSLLHDIGKPYENREQEVNHPLTGKKIQRRHQIVSFEIANELIPTDFSDRDLILSLIVEHDTPYRWFRQMEVTGFIPKDKVWFRLGRLICKGDELGHGIIYLILFELLDTHGHFHVNDVFWFIETANEIYLKNLGLEFPMPTESDLRYLVNSGF